jgi:hypothetical protein
VEYVLLAFLGDRGGDSAMEKRRRWRRTIIGSETRDGDWTLEIDGRARRAPASLSSSDRQMVLERAARVGRRAAPRRLRELRTLDRYLHLALFCANYGSSIDR